MTHDLATHKSGDWWNGLTIPQILLNTVPVVLTGATATFQVRAKEGDADTLLDLRSDGAAPGITITAPNGPIAIAPRLVRLPAGTWFYELELRLADGRVKTWLSGTWTITQDVVRRTYA